MKTLATLFGAMMLSIVMAAGAIAADLPTDKQCREGYKQGMQWTKEEFDAACSKVETNAAPGTHKK